METSSGHDRIHNLFQMLFEMAAGNLDFRVGIGRQDDSLDELGSVLNGVAAALRVAVAGSGNTFSHHPYLHLVQTTFVLDNSFAIEALGANVRQLLGYLPEMLFGIPFRDIISGESLPIWNEITRGAASEESFHTTVQLLLVSPGNKIIPVFCTVSRLLFNDKIFISTLSTHVQNPIVTVQPKPADNKQIQNATLIQQVHDYILDHLTEPLPSINEIARHFKTNEFRVKDGFRQFFSTSVYQFYNDARLKRAHLLIQQTDDQLKDIAIQCGFLDYTSFYRAFRKHFGYPPSHLARPGI